DQAADWQKKAEYIWRLFSESEESDLERQNNFAEKTYLTLKSELEGGDCFTLFTNKSRPGSNFNLKLQTVEGEYVSTPNGLKQSKNIVEGVEKAPDGSPLKNHFSEFHPGDRTRSGNKWTSRKIFDSRGRRNILHHYDKIRPGQTRGIPVLGPATGKLLQLGRASDAELMATVLNSYYAMVVQGPVTDTVMTKKSPNEPNTTLSDDANLTMGSGLIARVQPGTKIEGFDPKRPNL
ncbi:MAG: phage portal protein, partial [Proteobacteria bacterium]|nr:phage portal protein [Pseudomonadota bacterium]